MTDTAVQDPPLTARREEQRSALKLVDIVPSPTNPRKHFPLDYIADLSRSLADKGLMQPIIVRPGKRAGIPFEIVAGECRYRAARQAAWSEIDAIVRNYTDDEVLELQLIENIHRRDLAPLEEAAGYRQLIDSNPDKHSAESIATRIGKSPQYVWDRMKLNDLIPEAKMLLETERISSGHAILIARQTAEKQAQIIDPDQAENGFQGSRSGLWRTEHGGLDFDDEEAEKAASKDKYAGLKPVSVRELEHWIANHVRLDVAQAAEAQPFQFEDTAKAVAAAEARTGRGKKVVSITHDYRVSDDARDDADRTYGSQSWERADGLEQSKTCDFSVLGVVRAGRGRGDLLQVCVARDKCKVHFATEVRAREKREQERATRNAEPTKKTGSAAPVGQRSTAQLEKERLEAQRRKWREEAWEKQRVWTLKAFGAFAGKLKITAALVRAIVSRGYSDLTDIETIKQTFGVALTDKTAATVLLLATVNTYQLEEFGQAFVEEVKPFGFKTDGIETLLDQTVKDLEASEGANKRPLQTSGASVKTGSSAKKKAVVAKKGKAVRKGKKAA